MSKGRFFITGMGGMLGRHLASKAAEEGYEVGGTFHTSTTKTQNLDRLNIQSYCLDLIEPDDIKKAILDFKPDVVVHLAGKVLGSNDSSILKPEIFTENITILKNTLLAVKASKKRSKFILVSGCLVYDKLLSADFIKEAAVSELPRIDPSIHPYRASRIEQERLLVSEKNIDYIIVRPTQLTGPGKIPGVVEYYIAKEVSEAILNETKSKIFIGNKLGEVDIVDARDAARALLILASEGVSREIYHLSSGSPLAIATLIEIFLDAAGLKPENYTIHSKNEERSSYFRFSSDKLRQLGWQPEFKLKDTLANYYNFFRTYYEK